MEEKQPEEKLTPPVHKVFDKCPQCGSTQRDGEMEFEYRKKAGLVHKDSFPGGLKQVIPLIDPIRPPPQSIMTPNMMKIPVMTYHFDTCADCGVIYRTKFEVVDQMIPVQAQPIRNAPGFNPFKTPHS
jgi:hypothetical protein